MGVRSPEEIDAEIERLAQRLFEELRRDFVISIDCECDAQAVASVLSVKTKTLRNWRGLEYGPPSRTVHGVAWYSLRDVAAWITRQGRPDLERGTPLDRGSPRR